MRSQDIDFQEIVEYVKSELVFLMEEDALSKPHFRRYKSFPMIGRAIAAADRQICLHEKIHEPVAIFIPAGRDTIFFEEQEVRQGKWYEGKEESSNDDLDYAYKIGEDQFLSVISVKGNKGYLSKDLTNFNATSCGYYEHKSFESLKGSSGKYFSLHPNRRKMLLSTPVGSDMWMIIDAYIAPQQIKGLGQSNTDFKYYRIFCPYYAKAWLTLKTLYNLLPTPVLSQAGLIDTMNYEEQATRRRKPGKGNIHIGEGDYAGRPNPYPFNI